MDSGSAHKAALVSLQSASHKKSRSSVGGFIELGTGICRLGNCTCFPWWRTQAGNQSDAEDACRKLSTCIAYAVDSKTQDETSYHLFFSESSTGLRPRGNCVATDV